MSAEVRIDTDSVKTICVHNITSSSPVTDHFHFGTSLARTRRTSEDFRSYLIAIVGAGVQSYHNLERLDTGDIKAIPSFVKQVLEEHSGVDCTINNARVHVPVRSRGLNMVLTLVL